MKNRGKAFLTAVLVLVLLVFAMPFAVCAEDAHSAENHNHEGWTAWGDNEAEKTSLPQDGGAWYLTADVTLERDWEPMADTKLCLNGHVISTDNGSCLWVEAVNVDIYDETDSAVHYFRYNKGRAWSYIGDSVSESTVYLSDIALDVITDGTIIAIPGGVITGDNMFLSLYSDGADAPKTRVNIYGGSIVGIYSDYAEPVCITGDSALNMYGGGIFGCFFPYGDIISNRCGSVELLGGTIAGNIASGAVVHSGADADTTVAGSTAIHHNFAEMGAVYAGKTDVTLGGSARIRQNVTASAGTPKNVYLGSKNKVVLRSPEQGMSVGITAENVPDINSPVLICTAAAEGDEGYFFSDGEYYVKFKPSESSEDALYLTVSSGLASVFGSGGVWLIGAMGIILAAGIVALVIISRKQKADRSRT